MEEMTGKTRKKL